MTRRKRREEVFLVLDGVGRGGDGPILLCDSGSTSGGDSSSSSGRSRSPSVLALIRLL